MQEEKKAAASEQGKSRRRRRRRKNRQGTAPGAAPLQAAPERDAPETAAAPAEQTETAGPASEQADASEKNVSAAPEEQKNMPEGAALEASATDGKMPGAAPEKDAPAQESGDRESAAPAGDAQAEPPGAGLPAEGNGALHPAVPQEEAGDQPSAPESPQAAESAGETGEPCPAEEAPECAAAPEETAEAAAAPETPAPAGSEETEPSEQDRSAPEAPAPTEAAPGEEAPEGGGPEGAAPQPPEDGEAEEERSEEEEERSEEEEKRLSDMTRTVQLSIEQIMAQVGEEEPAAPEETEQSGGETPEEEGGGETVRALQKGLSGIAKWLLLVLFFVLVIAGFGVAWLYGNATPDMVPSIEVTFDGQTVEPTAYKWKVPVIGNVFKRTYADTLSSTPTALAETVDQASPDFEVSPAGYRDELTVTDSAGETVYEGDTKGFSDFLFTSNGEYTAKLVVYSDASKVPGDTSVTGSETWQFTFTVSVQPTIQLSAAYAEQGGAVAVRVGETLDGQPPVLTASLENPGFFRSGTGWICYIPIPWNAAAGTQELAVQAGGYTETFELEIRAAEWEYNDYYADSQLTAPYIGEDDLPASVEKLLESSEDAVAWANGNFVQPFLNSLDVKLAFGTTEYVGRSYSERSRNTGAGGRTATNVVLNTVSGEPLIAPANGTVVLAQDLGGDLGYTVVIDHGAGVKSLFFNLREVSVEKGDELKQGQVIAECGRTTVAEMRIGMVPIDPVQVWRGQCDAFKYY